MAKKNNRQDPELENRESSVDNPENDDTKKGNAAQSDMPVDETVRVRSEDSTPDVLSRELMETTVDDLTSQRERKSNGESPTIEPDPHDTLIPDDVAEPAEEADPSATIPILDSTVRVESSKDERLVSDLGARSQGSATDAEPEAAESETGPPPNVDPNDKTVGRFDQTIAVNFPFPKTSPGGRSVHSGKVAGREKASELSDTTVNVAGAGSILASDRIGDTVNPRELSENDVTLWNSAVGHDSDDPSVLPPAIDRTFSDTHFDRLRTCDVAQLKSDVAKASDYRLVRKIGQGGMGDVYAARQGSLDRLLALKLIKPLTGKKRAQLIKTGKLQTVEEERRQQFLSEAIVTGDLDHPNIVPIHDVAFTSNNELFYSMRRVIGKPWSKEIKKKKLDENLEILMKVADAVGFAHKRHVVHRDIKPDNIMIDDFGVVMVMDWGLALPTSEHERHSSIFATSGLGGTPAFMAPEMATGPLQKIGPSADIYLLGATLYMVITGRAPHHGKNVTDCLKAVRSNHIRTVSEEQQGELMDIALRAMATNPKDRYQDVKAFQTALHEYRSHAASISLASKANDDFEEGKRKRSYKPLSNAAFRFQEALESWNGNEKAHQGLAETKLVHANMARENGDYDLGLSLLDKKDPEHQPIIRQLRRGKARRTWLKLGAAAMLATIIVGGSAGTYVIDQKRVEAERQKAKAEEQTLVANLAKDKLQDANVKLTESIASEKAAREEAQAATMIAEAAKQNAESARDDEEKAKLLAQKNEKLAKENEKLARQREQEAREAERNEAIAKEKAVASKIKAEQQEKIAVAAQKIAAYEAYTSSIALAKARLSRSEVDGARAILDHLGKNEPQVTDTWEWRWLWQQANRSESAEKSEDAVIDMSLGSLGRSGVISLGNGSFKRMELAEGGRLTPQSEAIRLPNHQQATAVAMSPDESSYAIGTESGDIFLFQGNAATDGKPLTAHEGRVTDLQYSVDGLLVSGSADKTVRVWDTRSRIELTKANACWHISPVRQVAVSGSGSALTLAVAIADDETGRVAIWNLRPSGGDGLSLKRQGTMKHTNPVSSVALSASGLRVASGDVFGSVFVWNPAAAEAIDYGKSIQNALDRINGSGSSAKPRPSNSTARMRELVDPSLQSERRLISTSPSPTYKPRAHSDVVKAIRFSDDGKSIVTSSDDYTLKLWDASSRRIHKTFKGHGGWVVSAEFLRGKTDVIVSASNDATVRTWKPKSYVGAFVRHQLTEEATTKKKRVAQAHDKGIGSASFSRDGRKVVTASNDHTARVMEIDPQTLAFKVVARLEDEVLDEGSPFVAMSMRVDRGHKRLYVGSADTTIRVWDLQRGTQIGEAAGTGLNTSFALANDGQFMLTGSNLTDVKAILWKLDPTGNSPPRELHRLKGHDQAVTAYAISPDSKRLFTGDRSGYGVIWDAGAGTPIGSPVENVRGSRINAASFSADGNELLIASDNQQLTVIDVESRRTTGQMTHEGFVTQLSLSSDGRHALTVSELSSETRFRSTATLWDLRNQQGRVLDTVTDKQGSDDGAGSILRRITSAEFDGQGRIAVVGRSADGENPASVRVWNVNHVVPARAQRTLTRADISDSANRTAGATPAQGYQLPAILGTTEAVLPIDAKSLLTMNKNGAFKWDLESDRLIKSYRSHAELTEACFSYDGKYVVTGSRSVRIWDAATGKALAKLESELGSRPIRSVQFAPRSLGPTRYLFATGGDEGIARIWVWDPDTEKASLYKEQNLDDDDRRTIRRVRFSPTSNQLFVVGDELARLWDFEQPGVSVSMKQPGQLLCAAFSRDGNLVAAGGKDKTVRIWELPEPGGEMKAPVVLAGHADAVHDIAILGTSKEELRVMTASADDSAKVWDPRIDSDDKTGREIISLRRHAGDVTSVDITDDGGLLMTAGKDGAVILWPAPPPPQPN